MVYCVSFTNCGLKCSIFYLWKLIVQYGDVLILNTKVTLNDKMSSFNYYNLFIFDHIGGGVLRNISHIGLVLNYQNVDMKF